MMDLFLMIRLHSRTFCLEQRLGQFNVEVSSVGEADQRFVHSFAANLWTDSNLSERVEEAGSQTLLQ